MGQLSCSHNHNVRRKDLEELPTNQIRPPAHLLAVVGGVLLARQPVIGPAVQVRVVAAHEAVAGEAHGAHTLEQSLGGQAQVHTLGVPVAGVCVVLARIVGFAHLLGQVSHFLSGQVKNETKKLLDEKECSEQPGCTCFKVSASCRPRPNGWVPL